MVSISLIPALALLYFYVSIIIIIIIIIIVIIIIIIPPARYVSNTSINLKSYVNKRKFLFLLFVTNMLEAVLSKRYTCSHVLRVFCFC